MQNKSEYDKNQLEIGRESFLHHKIVKGRSGWKLVRGEGDYPCGAYWAEIVPLEAGRVLVHGDISPVIFSGCAKRDAREMIFWAGESHFDYMASKAVMAMGHESIYTDCVDVAESDVRELMADQSGKVLEELEEILEDFLEWHGCVSPMRYEIDKLGIWDGETIGRIGRVIDSKVHFAYAALERLAKLLREEQRVADELTQESEALGLYEA